MCRQACENAIWTLSLTPFSSNLEHFQAISGIAHLQQLIEDSWKEGDDSGQIHSQQRLQEVRGLSIHLLRLAGGIHQARATESEEAVQQGLSGQNGGAQAERDLEELLAAFNVG